MRPVLLLAGALLLALSPALGDPAVVVAGAGQVEALRELWYSHSQRGAQKPLPPVKFVVTPPPGVQGSPVTVSMSNPGEDRASPFGAGLLAQNQVGSRVPVASYSHWTPPETLPEEFDARAAYPSCRTMRAVQNQGACAGCYSFASVASLGDRICMATNGSVDAILSAEDPLFCPNLGGCRGGNLGPVWDYLANVGVRTI